MSSSSDSLPEWVAEHQARYLIGTLRLRACHILKLWLLQSPWQQSQAALGTSNSSESGQDQPAGKLLGKLRPSSSAKQGTDMPMLLCSTASRAEPA